MALTLVIRSAPHNGKEIRVSHKRYVIGRAPECQLRPGSEKVSRKHCQIIIEEHRVQLEDLGSGNGTLINGQRVTGFTEISNGDIISVGPMKLEVVLTTLRPAASSGSALDDDASWVADGKPISMGDTRIMTADDMEDPDLAGPAPKLPPPVTSRRPSALEALRKLQEDQQLWNQ